MEILAHVPTDKIEVLFRKIGESMEDLPTDTQVLKYYRTNFPQLAISGPVAGFLPSGGGIGRLKELKDKYPEFTPFLDMFIDFPDRDLPEDARKKFFSMLQNPKNFKEA